MGKKVHILSNIDPVARMANCAHCGFTSIRKMATRWRCNIGHPRHNRPYRKHKKNKCERCGFKPQHHSQLDVDHIDGNRQNNTAVNLMTLCANCHRLKTHENQDYKNKKDRLK